jgi:hypothetical protein
MAPAPAVELPHQVNHHPIMLLHLTCVPFGVRGLKVAVGTDLPAKAGKQELFAHVHQVDPAGDTRLGRGPRRTDVRAGWTSLLNARHRQHQSILIDSITLEDIGRN